MLRRLRTRRCFGPASLLTLGVLLVVAAGAVVGQDTPRTDVPHEPILAPSPREAPRLTELRDWRLVDGTTFPGRLVQWLGADELIHIEGKTTRTRAFPLRQFVAEDQAGILEAFGSWRDTILRLHQLEPLRHPSGRAWMQGDQPLERLMLLDVQGDASLWHAGTMKGYPSIPLSTFTAQQRQQLQDRVAQRDQLPRWQSVVPNCAFAAKLEGKAGDTYIFSGLWNYMYLNPLPVRFGLRAHFLSDADRKRADTMAAALAGNAPAVPDLWCWPGEQMLLGPAQPQGIEGGQLICLVPHHQAERASDPAQRQRRGYSLNSFAPISELEVRLVLEEAELRASSPSVPEQRIAEALRSKRAELIDQRPLHYLADTRYWRLRDSSSTFEATLAGQVGAYYVMLSGPQAIPVAALKNEFSEASAAAAQVNVRRLEEYFTSHPDADRPPLATRFRWVRRLGMPSMTQPLEPVEVRGTDEHAMFFFSAGPGQPSQGGPRIPKHDLHWIDAQELQLVISGATLDDSATAPGEAAVASGRSAGDAALPAGGREQKLQAMKIQQYLEQPPSWALAPAENAPPGRNLFAFRAAVLGRHQDSFIMRRDGFDFLVDGEMLTADAQTRAEERIAHFEGLIRGTNFNLSVPKARLWSGVNGQLVGPGTEPELLENGDFQFTGADGQRETIAAARIGSLSAIELKTQLAADAEVRASSGNDRSLEEIQAFKSEMRTQLQKELRQQERLQSVATWIALESQDLIVGNFERFDGDDVILRDENGNHFRVFQFAFGEQSIARMEQLAQGYQAEGKPGLTDDLDITTVTARYFRPRGSHRPARGTLVTATRDSLVVSTGGGGTAQLPVSHLHHLDVSEARSRWYRQQHSIAPDTRINDRLRRPIESNEVLRELPPLADAFRQRLEALTQPQQRVWTEQPLELRGGERVVGIATDGSRCIVAGASVRILGRQGETIGEFQIDLDREAPAFLADQHRQLASFTGGKLTLWDLTQRAEPKVFSDIKEITAAAQSADGKRIVLATASGTLWIVQPELGSSQKIELELGPDELLQGQIWCSQDGARLATASRKHLFLLRIDGDSGKFQVESKSALQRPVATMAASPAGFYVSYGTETAVTAFEITDGRIAHTRREMGMLPRWFGAELSDGKFWFRALGLPPGGTSTSPYAFAVTYNLRGERVGIAQIIEHDLSGPTHIAAAGNAVAFLRGDSWILASPPPPFSRDTLLRLLADELVDDQRIDQLDAVWNNLRNEPYAALGDYPDHLAELFLEHLQVAVQNYQWQHGGDLKERAELLLSRWSERAPQSVVVPVLRSLHHHGLAWDARGSGFADSVSEAAFELFNQQMRLSAQAIKPVLDQRNPPTRAYMLAYEAAMSLSLPLETVKRFHTQMMETPARWSPPAHTAVVLYLLPRWHGGPGDSERYIRAVADRLGGEQGDAMYTRLMLYAAQFYPAQEPASNHLDIDLDRVLKGLRSGATAETPNPAVIRQAVELFQRERRRDLLQQALQLAVEQRIYFLK